MNEAGLGIFCIVVEEESVYFVLIVSARKPQAASQGKPETS